MLGAVLGLGAGPRLRDAAPHRRPEAAHQGGHRGQVRRQRGGRRARRPGARSTTRREQAHIAVDEEVVNAANGPASEAFRKLRTNLMYMNVDNPPRVVVVTSPLPGDGKSTVAANLAAAIDSSGQNVVLIDGDLRRPTVATWFGLVEGVGLTDVLAGRIPVEDALQTTPEHPNLRILGAGAIPPNPSELLGSQVDAAAAAEAVGGCAGADRRAAAAAGHRRRGADGPLPTAPSWWCRRARPWTPSSATALDHLSAVEAKALGVVLNRVSTRDAGSGYYDQYNGYYAAVRREEPRQEVTGRGRGRVAAQGRTSRWSTRVIASPSSTSTTSPTRPGSSRGRRRRSGGPSTGCARLRRSWRRWPSRSGWSRPRSRPTWWRSSESLASARAARGGLVMVGTGLRLRAEEAVPLLHALIARAADDLGVRVLAIKGPVVALQGLREQRTSADVDVLVHPRDLEPLVDGLVALGWRRVGEGTYASDHAPALGEPPERPVADRDRRPPLLPGLPGRRRARSSTRCGHGTRW